MENEFYRFQLGDFKCVSLYDGSMNYKLESMVVNQPKEPVEAYLREHNLPVEHITTPYAYLFVDTGQNRLLVDMGAGQLAPTTGMLLHSMCAAGINPDEIDTVFITHAHPDHIGGTLDDQGRLVYANARYFIWKDEWDFWFSNEALAKTGEFFTNCARDNLSPLQGRVTLVEDENELLPGVRAIAAPGHTPGHVVVAFTSQGKQMFYAGDTVLYPFHLEHPDWLPVFDILPEKAAISKHRIFDLAAEARVLVLGQHFPPFPNLGTIKKQNNGWFWQPIMM